MLWAAKKSNLLTTFEDKEYLQFGSINLSFIGTDD